MQLDKFALAEHSWDSDSPVKSDESQLLVPVKNYFYDPTRRKASSRHMD